MIIGKTRQEHRKDFNAKLHQALSLAVPCKVFAWLPKELESGQIVWLEHVWRFGYSIKVSGGTKFKYCLTREEALALSKTYNCSANVEYRDELHKLLSKVQ